MREKKTPTLKNGSLGSVQKPHKSESFRWLLIFCSPGGLGLVVCMLHHENLKV